MSAAVASSYVRRMVERESRGSGDTEGAMRRLEAKFGIAFWSLWHLRLGRAKSVDADLFQRIRAAYLAHCEMQIAHLQHDLAVERTLGADDALEDLEAQAADLVTRIKEAKEKLGRRR